MDKFLQIGFINAYAHTFPSEIPQARIAEHHYTAPRLIGKWLLYLGQNAAVPVMLSKKPPEALVEAVAAFAFLRG